MRARLLIFSLLVLLTACTSTLPPISPPQELSGVISSDLTLSGEILLTGDLLILPGRTLTLHPGTTVRVRKAESTKIDPEYLSSLTEILVRGNLLAEGTAAAPITFLPETTPSAGEIVWAGITLDHSPVSSLRHLRIEGAEQGILVISSSPQLAESTISNCRYGLVVQGPGSAGIYNNQINAGEGGLFVLAGASPAITGNRITAQVEEGLFVDAVSAPRLGRNEISGNAIGLVLHNPRLPFDPDGISTNREDLRLIGRE
ncbi:MAG: right-handed parallel beta-helix repeat-containing protein [Desulfuromonadales bacterium]|nr:right-handed parallel beta-helix repeat-containing protein [Desulfuromonadales bacterium]